MKNTPPWGPTPTPSHSATSEDALDPARRRLLRLIASHRESLWPTVNNLVAAVGGHPNTTRHHLRALVSAGLVEAQRLPSAGGRGRPATRYAVTRAGREAATLARGSAAADEYVALAAAFAERLAGRGGDVGADARAIGNAWGVSLVAREDQDRVAGDSQASPADQVVELLARLGFSPEAEPGAQLGSEAGSEAGSETTVLLRTCPLLDAARRHPDVVCEVHLGLVGGALGALHQPTEGLRLEPFARPGACVLGLPVALAG